MRVSQFILLLIVVSLLAVSVVAGEIAFRLERTVFSYRYTYEQLQNILKPLDDPAIHTESVHEAFRFIRKKLSLPVPKELEGNIVQAAVTGFSASRLKRTAGLWLLTAEKVLHGTAGTIAFPLSLSPFKSAFLASLHGKYSVAEQMEIGDALDEIPSVIDFADELPESLKARLLGFGRSMAYFQMLLQYIIPGLLIIACFFHRRIGAGILSVGAGLLLSGVPSFVVTSVKADAIARWTAESLVQKLPEFAAWVGTGIERSVAAIVRSGTVTAILVTVSGALFFAVGMFLVVRKAGGNGVANSPEPERP